MGTRSKTSARRTSRNHKRSPSRERARHAPLGAPEAHAAALERVASERAKAVARELAPTPTVRALCLLMEESYDRLDRMQGELVLDPPMACARGCCHCCYNQVSVTPPEALYLGLHLLEAFTPERRAVFSARMDNVLELIRGKTRREMSTIRHLTPCPFLEPEGCSVYPARPLACRGWNSVDAQSCRLSVEERDPMRMIENHGLFRELADAVQLGLLQGTQAAGLEAGYLVITRAARLMLDRGVVECAGQWLEGGLFFGGARVW